MDYWNKRNRDALVERIKMAGQDIIDRAESFVAEDMELITDFTIYISFGEAHQTTISTTCDTISKKEYRVKAGLE